MGVWRYSSTIIDLSIRWRWVVSFMPLPHYPWGKSPWYPLDRRLGGPWSWPGEKSCPCLQSNPYSPAQTGHCADIAIPRLGLSIMRYNWYTWVWEVGSDLLFRQSIGIMVAALCYFFLFLYHWWQLGSSLVFRRSWPQSQLLPLV
jgi:hypothetical protein